MKPRVDFIRDYILTTRCVAQVAQELGFRLGGLVPLGPSPKVLTARVLPKGITLCQVRPCIM
jgi:hypothetical protein